MLTFFQVFRKRKLLSCQLIYYKLAQMRRNTSLKLFCFCNKHHQKDEVFIFLTFDVDVNNSGQPTSGYITVYRMAKNTMTLR